MRRPSSSSGRRGRTILTDYLRERRPKPVPVFLKLHFEPGEGAAHNVARLEALGPGVTYLICHPARGGEELSAITPDAHMRDFERRFYGGEEGRRALEQQGIHCIGMRRLRDLVRQPQPGSPSSSRRRAKG